MLLQDFKFAIFHHLDTYHAVVGNLLQLELGVPSDVDEKFPNIIILDGIANNRPLCDNNELDE